MVVRERVFRQTPLQASVYGRLTIGLQKLVETHYLLMTTLGTNTETQGSTIVGGNLFIMVTISFSVKVTKSLGFSLFSSLISTGWKSSSLKSLKPSMSVSGWLSYSMMICSYVVLGVATSGTTSLLANAVLGQLAMALNGVADLGCSMTSSCSSNFFYSCSSNLAYSSFNFSIILLVSKCTS